MTTIETTSSRYGDLSIVRDGDVYVLGSRHSTRFVSVPPIGGQVVLWLRDGHSIEECTELASEIAGEPVDVAGFVNGLVQAGLLPAADAEPVDAPESLASWKRRFGRIVFGPVGLTVQSLLTVAAIVTMIVVPRTRPVYLDAIASRLPLVSLLLIAVIGTALGLAHELAHVLAAWAAGVSSRVSISRRMVMLVYQTDLSRLWSVPRRSRVVPLLAGLLFDSATIGALTLAELTGLGGAPAYAVHLIRTVVFLNVSGIVFQFLIFLRTDVYALFVLATGCKHLWDVKGAVARQAIGRATEADLRLLSTVGPREKFWAKMFLCLYVPGVAFTTWYFIVYAVPALHRILTMALHAVFTDGLRSPVGAAGALAFTLSVASTGFILWGLMRTLIRVALRAFTRRTPGSTDVY